MKIKATNHGGGIWILARQVSTVADNVLILGYLV